MSDFPTSRDFPTAYRDPGPTYASDSTVPLSASPAAEIAAMRARVAELEAEVDNKAAQAWRDGADDATATWQRDITAWRQKAEALEASRARLAAASHAALEWLESDLADMGQRLAPDASYVAGLELVTADLRAALTKESPHD